MSPLAKIILSVIGVAIGGMGIYYEVHVKDVIDARFWLGLVFAALVPVGTYFVGLGQRAPWEGPTLPTTVIETKRTTTDPPPSPGATTVSETTKKPPGGS